MKLQLIYLTLCSLTQAAYISRMALFNQNLGSINQNRLLRSSVFRPGLMVRPLIPRLVSSPSQRMPYVFYRNSPQRYSVKHYTPTRMVTSPWKGATRVPNVTAPPTSAGYEFVRAAATSSKAHAESGAIHTIPAPNLSLLEKPIVVLEDNSRHNSVSVTSEKPKLYEKKNQYPDPTILHLAAKIEQPIGFSKPSTLSQPDVQSLVRNGAALQLASELGLSAISLPQNSIPQPVHHTTVTTQHSIPQQHLQQNIPQQFVQQQSIVPQQFTLHNFHSLPNAQEFMQAAPDGIIITPNALYQPDPSFLQKLQNQLLQRFPGVEFVPYAAGFEPVSAQPQQNQIQNQILFQPSQNQYQPQQVQSNTQTHVVQPQHILYQQNHEPQPSQSQTQTQVLPQPQTQNQISIQPSVTIQAHKLPFILLQNEQYTRHTPSSFVAAESQNVRNYVQRETQEGTIVTLVPQVIVTNSTENLVEVTSISNPQNITVELMTSESKPDATTVKYIIETTTEEQKTTPINNTPVTQSINSNNVVQENVNNVHVTQASQVVTNTVQTNQNHPKRQLVSSIANIGNVQVEQSTGNVVTDSFYSTINDIRAGAALAEVDKPIEPSTTQENLTTTTINPTTTLNADLKPYFVQKQETDKQNQSVTEIKPTLGVPFAKSQNSVNIAYTLLRSDNEEAEVAKDGSVYAGQLVEASVSEDHDFNKQKANLLNRRAPIRLVAVAENKDANTTTTTQRTPQRVTVVKARIPPKSKLTFDDKTGEPVLRIYASYVDSSTQKEATASKMTNSKNIKEIAPRKQDSMESWKAANVKALAKPHGFEPSADKVTQFGVKLRSRSDDYVPLFDDYED